MENSLLLRKIAMSFSQTTGLEFDDLFQEASLAYLEALRTHDPSRGKITTHLWHCVHNRLKNYLRDYKKYATVSINDVQVNEVVHEIPLFENLSETAFEVAKVVLTAPEEFVCLTQEEAKKKLKHALLGEGWSMKKILTGMKELSVIYSY